MLIDETVNNNIDPSGADSTQNDFKLDFGLDARC